jgi:hypothetical protein
MMMAMVTMTTIATEETRSGGEHEELPADVARAYNVVIRKRHPRLNQQRHYTRERER